jgi:glycyl-tRNA synthetase alpha chain
LFCSFLCFLINVHIFFCLALFAQKKKNGETLDITYGDVFFQNEVEQSIYNFESSNPEFLFLLFDKYESEAKRLLDISITIPAYEMILKSAHIFNLLDARGVISVTERAGYIGRIRDLSRIVAQSYFDSRKKMGFPLLKTKLS